MQLWVIMIRPFIEVRVWKHFPTIPFCQSLPDFCKRELYKAIDYLIKKSLDQINRKFRHLYTKIRDKVDKIRWCKCFPKSLKRGEQYHALKPEYSLKQTFNNLYVSRNIIRVCNNQTNMRFPVHVEHVVDFTHSK